MSNAVGRAFDPRSSQTKDYKIGICCFSTKHVALRRKRKDWLARNQDSVSEWGDMSIPPLPNLQIMILKLSPPRCHKEGIRTAN
jgi:hypothetical protein